ncbi:MAG: DUF1614 domain-containing protein [Deltaproteobacteria bacterium]|nr:DUF1614 domain-containing protein [Deltaproteobacteria bacterium]
MFFPPLLLFVIIFFFFLVVFLFALLKVGLIGLAFTKLGLPPEYLFGMLLLTLLGSYVNIPIGELGGGQIIDNREVRYFGMRYRPPHQYRRQKTILAINLGGALIPLIISLYLFSRMASVWPALLATLIVTAVVNRLARPIKGIGIGIPALVPPLVAALAAYILAGPEMRAPVAYIAGTLGTLIGADLLRLNDIKNMGAPVASIGGAGTFDGVFLSGIIAVLLS